jgi:hypothetical protein
MSAAFKLTHRRGLLVRTLTVLPGQCYRGTAWMEGLHHGLPEGFSPGTDRPVAGEGAHWVDEFGVLSGGYAVSAIEDAPDVPGWSVIVASHQLLPPDPLGRALAIDEGEVSDWGGFSETFTVDRAVRAATLGAVWVQVGRHWVVGIHRDGTTTGVWR